MDSYRRNKTIKAKQNIHNILISMPEYMTDFADSCLTRGLNPNTVLAYLYDIHSFFLYLGRQRHTTIESITVDDLKALRRADYLTYIEYMSPNMQEKATLRTLSSLSALFSFFCERAEYECEYNIPKSIDKNRFRQKTDIKYF